MKRKKEEEEVEEAGGAETEKGEGREDLVNKEEQENTHQY